jgi:PDDEXK-like domain of unknown function (DUF3799)
MKTLIQLTAENYHSLKANQDYMSNSQYKDFRKCEASALAKVKGEWFSPPSDALLVGSYVHAGIEGVLDEFKADNPSLFTKKGELYSQYKHADKMLHVLQEDPFCMFVLEGQQEIIITEEFAGVMWKAKLDVYNQDRGRIVDLKTCKSIRDKVWDKDRGYVSFVEAYGYIGQMALYTELEKRHSGRKEWLEPLIVAVSKEEVPDKAIINFDNERLAVELEEVERNMPRIIAVKHGNEKPNRCDKCDYCKATKKVKTILHYSELIDF